MFIAASLLVLALEASGTATLPDISDARNDAVNVALTMDLVTTALAGNCAKLNAETRKQAEHARSLWKARNWYLVEPAHQYLVLVRAALAQQKGPGAGKHYYDRQKAQFVKQAQAALASYFPRGQPDAESCGTVVKLLSEGTMDLKQKPVVFETLTKIKAEMDAFRAK